MFPWASRLHSFYRWSKKELDRSEAVDGADGPAPLSGFQVPRVHCNSWMPDFLTTFLGFLGWWGRREDHEIGVGF